MTKKLSLLLFTLLVCYCHAGEYIPSHNPVPGGIYIKKLAVQTPKPPKLYLYNHQVMTLPEKSHSNRWYALIGIPLSARKNAIALDMRFPINKKIQLDIKKKKYGRQRLTIKNKKYKKLNHKQKQRIAREKKEIKLLLKHRSQRDPWQESYELPLNGRITSQFGLRRTFNRKNAGNHLGVDIAAPLGKKVKAPASGVVLAIKNQFYNGRTVYLDHGNGVITVYTHLNRIFVKARHHVAKGKSIGTVGLTGRTTGPHLHWETIINQIHVDPMLIIQKSN